MRASGPVRKTLPWAAKLPGLASGGCVRVEDDLVFAGAEEDGLHADEEEADGDAGEGEGVGEELGLPVHDEEADEEEAEDGEAEGCADVEGTCDSRRRLRLPERGCQ